MALYSSAFSRVRVGAALSPAFAVQRGVAQVCPLSPLLYAIFIDPVLQDMQSLSHPDMLWVGPPTSKRNVQLALREHTALYRTPAFIWSSPILGHLQISL